MTAQPFPACMRTDPHVCTFGRMHTTTLRERLLRAEGVVAQDPPRTRVPVVPASRYAGARRMQARPLTLWEAIALDHEDER